jgi:hypothetical protein
METLKNELRTARQYVAAESMDQAERHIRIALDLYDEAPPGSLPYVRKSVAQAGRAVLKSDAKLALFALDGALGMLGDRDIPPPSRM